MRFHSLNSKQRHCFILASRWFYREHFALKIDPLQDIKWDDVLGADAAGAALGALPVGVHSGDRAWAADPPSENHCADPMFSYLGGCAGTGKSRVINAIRSLYELYGLSSSLVIAAFTGTAAVNVRGNTLHHELGIGVAGNANNLEPASCADTHRLKLRWGHVSLLIIDEVSFVSCSFLSTIESQLRSLRKGDATFGNVGVLAVGDFMQLPPVQELPLMGPNTNDGRIRGHDGLSLWRDHFKTVVQLDQRRPLIRWGGL